MTETNGDKDRPPRFMSRDARRLQLIEATIETLAQRGFSRCTLTEVAKTAGLSHGLVLFHFETKEKLLAETLAHLAEEYRANWTSALAKAGLGAAEQLNALIEADFDLNVFTPSRLYAWCAFRGEAQSRPLYQESCGEKDQDYNRTMEAICQRLIDEGGYGGSAVMLARIVRVTIEGVWLDRMTMAEPYGTEEALATARLCAARCFPKHFTESGLR